MSLSLTNHATAHVLLQFVPTACLQKRTGRHENKEIKFLKARTACLLAETFSLEFPMETPTPGKDISVLSIGRHDHHSYLSNSMLDSLSVLSRLYESHFYIDLWSLYSLESSTIKTD
jgi:hypothetical protein